MDSIAQHAPQTLRGRMYNQDSIQKEKRILVLKTGVAGLRHHIENEEERAALETITPGTELFLYREPENEYDEWAVAVHLTEEDKLGYITRFKNETISRLMDAGKKFIAIVDDPETDPEAGKIVEKDHKKHAHTGTEDMSVPFSVYLVE